MTIEWKKSIAIANMVRAHVADLDDEELWPYFLPEVAASESQIVEAERALNEIIPADYREFLCCANGWQCFHQAIDLFGLSDLITGSRRERALRIVSCLEPLENICGIHSDEVWPIAVSREDEDVFLIARESSRNAGEVYWVAGRLIEKFVNFREFFLSMVDLNREDIRSFREEN